jgi:hypothetical protein
MSLYAPPFTYAAPAVILVTVLIADIALAGVRYIDGTGIGKQGLVWLSRILGNEIQSYDSLVWKSFNLAWNGFRSRFDIFFQLLDMRIVKGVVYSALYLPWLCIIIFVLLAFLMLVFDWMPQYMDIVKAKVIPTFVFHIFVYLTGAAIAFILCLLCLFAVYKVLIASFNTVRGLMYNATFDTPNRDFLSFLTTSMGFMRVPKGAFASVSFAMDVLIGIAIITLITALHGLKHDEQDQNSLSKQKKQQLIQFTKMLTVMLVIYMVVAFFILSIGYLEQ